MVQYLSAKRLSWFGFFKLCCIGNAISLGLVWAGLVVTALLGFPVVRWEDNYVSGTMSLLAGPLVVVVAGFLLGLFQSAFAFLGLLVFSRFRNSKISYLPLTT